MYGHHGPGKLGTAEIHRGCVKTHKSQQGGELFSLLPFPRSQLQRYSSLDRRNREGLSTRRLNACVFTQPPPTAAAFRTISDGPPSTQSRPSWALMVAAAHAPFPVVLAPQSEHLTTTLTNDGRGMAEPLPR